MKFLEPILSEQFLILNFRLRAIVFFLETLMAAFYHKVLTITSVYRPAQDSPHAFSRAVDVRSFELFNSDCFYLLNLINLFFPYGHANLQTMIWHDTGHGWHFYLQVRP